MLLDAYGTLLELRPPAPILRRLLRERFGVEVSGVESKRAIAAEVAYYRRHLNEGRDAASVDELRGRCSEILRAALGSEPRLRAAGAGEFTELLLASLQFRPFPEAAAALAELHSAGVRLVVASNWDASLPQRLRAIGLLDHVDGVVTSAECGASKPDPVVFERALSVAGVSPNRAIHVGDSMQEDIGGARAIGITPVLIARGRRVSYPGVRTISSLLELLTMPELAT